MPKYVIERDLPGAGSLSADELRDIARTSNDVLKGMSTRAQWVQSYVTDDKIYCVYVAEDETAVRDHAAQGGFPCTAVSEVATIIDPVTADM
ncbi:DUF4242 domain-containing protein [Euzebya sp.]|uniref:DUF4242 domain-containing protein n=1 Tax=Euzebya sp. TaxID=1971409 RepID=UPI00351140E1